MSAVRSDIWCAAFVRRHNGLGNFCVVARKGDAIAGQVWIEVDHLDGTRSLHTQMSSAAQGEGDGDRVFQKRFERVEPERIAERIAREIDFDPDIWVLSLDMRGDDIGV
ncbi:DUF1491 family protein [Pelagibacterium lacus]|uniref:DUF1491 family protein n=1 Tax=Pelagibacterium lacus TaxID=2282655 RepID=A0A369W724_9HYPH|nr:DUF1491 family protein [Pelagibacterium lacus]RDE10494.1 DUF1491 family protein [Pelagibacterium lacus]